MRQGTNILGNVYDKYNTRNPLAQSLFRHFLGSFRELLTMVPVSSLLEVGCGEGQLSRLMQDWLKLEADIFAVDLSGKSLDSGLCRRPRFFFSAQSVYQLAFPSDSFDLVVAVEVLEHLARPQEALLEMLRVTRNYVLFSVPREPIWRFLNLARFAYWRDLGNTPGHIQHWSASRFLALVGNFFKIVQVRAPLPWTVVLAVKKSTGS